MRDVLSELMAWYDAARRSASAPSWRRSSRRPGPPGASMLVGPDGTAVGSVSGGCVEGAVYDLAETVVASGSRSCSATASRTTTRSRSA